MLNRSGEGHSHPYFAQSNNTPFEQSMQLSLGHLQGEYLVETYPSKFKQSGKLYNKGYILLSK
jgi:hypothetical protein